MREDEAPSAGTAQVKQVARLSHHDGWLPAVVIGVLTVWLSGCSIELQGETERQSSSTDGLAGATVPLAAGGPDEAADGSPPDGACCFVDGCEELAEEVCLDDDGEFLGEGSDCDICVPLAAIIGALQDRDSDNDGVSDLDELLGDDGPDEPLDDIDGDGILNAYDRDVDGDGIPNEFDFDIDGDGIINPLDLDIDGDGISNLIDNDDDADGKDDDDRDGCDSDSDCKKDEKCVNGNCKGPDKKCDPENDSDKDGLCDEDDPDPDGNGDTDDDDDGISDGQEIADGTDPTNPDTDGDGLSDGEEAALGTDPTDADTDDDGLSDGEEVALGTNPSDADTDNDGLSDGEEVALGTNPNDADGGGDGNGE